MIDKNDKRLYYRKNSLIIAKYVTVDREYNGVLTDISAGGLFVRTILLPVLGQAVTLKFSLFSFDESISVSGTVTRIQENGFAVKFDEPIESLARKEDDFPSIVNECDR